jgi:membrane protein
LLRRIRSWTPVRVLSAYGASQASNYAAALAFAGFLAMFPMMLGALSVIGFLVRDPATESRFMNFLVQLFPNTAQLQLMDALTGVKQSAGWMGLVSLGGLVWSASGIFSSMEFAFTQIFGTKQRGMVRQKAMGLVMMLLLVVAIGATVAVNSIVNLFPMAWLVSLVVGGLVMVTMLVLLYRFVPNRTFKLRQALPGAILAGVLIEVLTLAFPFYQRISHGFNTYGAQFGLFFLIATWLYLLSQVVLLGAVYNRFRLGEPHKLGLVASPAGTSEEVRPPVEEIKKERARAGAPEVPAPGISKPKSRRSPAKRGAVYVVLGAALAGADHLRRRRKQRAAG